MKKRFPWRFYLLSVRCLLPFLFLTLGDLSRDGTLQKFCSDVRTLHLHGKNNNKRGRRKTSCKKNEEVVEDFGKL